MVQTHNLGFPRIGSARELKWAQEQFWRGEIDERALRQIGSTLRSRHWDLQAEAGIAYVPVGDFAWYDHVLTHCALFGALPERFGFNPHTLDLNQYFQLARGNSEQAAMELTKWFDTNYHYLVPEWQRDTEFSLQSRWIVDDVREALARGLPVKPVLVGPLTLLWLGRAKTSFDKLSLLSRLLPEYVLLLKELADLGVEWVQLDEPILALDLPQSWLNALWSSYRRLALSPVKILLATYFGSVERHRDQLHSLPVDGVHLDLIRAPEQLAAFVQRWPEGKVLSAGMIDGRNIWRADLDESLGRLSAACERLGGALWLAPSCSLLHCPIDLELEDTLDADLRSWLAFGKQKLHELAVLKTALEQGQDQVAGALSAARGCVLGRRQSPRVHCPLVKRRAAAVREADLERSRPYAERITLQQAKYKLPPLPTTTIGSFPQTAEIRAARAAWQRGDIDDESYEAILAQEIGHAIAQQEEIGLDVLVHGEAERNDMVEYFARLLSGFAFTQNGWVQSYGSRCVKPPIIYGDVSRPEAMTVKWSRFAQSLSSKPVKGMLTGPVTLLHWSFVRDDQPRRETAVQLALAIRDEIADLEAAGLGIIQIDEPAFREGLPLSRRDWETYLDWAVNAFRLAAGGAQDQTQIHTHMCYSEFNDILPAIAALDADVITIETARSDMKLLEGFAQFDYPNDIGPGVYDIHSPRLPRREDMLRRLTKAAAVVDRKRLWINPDCGLKTRNWPETRAALQEMVAAAKMFREREKELDTPERLLETPL